MSTNLPHIFYPGQKAKAEEVNTNFATLKNAVNANESAISANGSLLAALQSEKAHKNGSESEVFSVAPPTSGSHAVSRCFMESRLKGYINGLVLSISPADATNDIVVSAGICADSSGCTLIHLSAAITKQLDNAFAEGDNQGGLDTGTKQANTWYHVFAVAKDDGTADVLFSACPDSPTLPPGYTMFRRVGSVYSDPGGSIRPFKQNGDRFLYRSQVQELNLQGVHSRVARTISVPTGVEVDAVLMLYPRTDARFSVYVTGEALSMDNDVPQIQASVQTGGGTSGYIATINQGTVRTNTASQIRTTLSSQTYNGGAGILEVYTRGYVDKRGKQ